MNESMNDDITAHWGSAPVNPDEHSLPALKVRFVLRRLPDRGKLLEIGSGDGKILRTIARHKPELELHGCDVRVVEADCYTYHRMTPDIDLPDGSMDVVLIVDVLEHVPDARRILAEAARVLRPGGRFMGFIPVEGERVSFYEIFRRVFGQDVYAVTKEHVLAFTHEQVRALLSERFDVDEIRYAYHLLGHFMDAAFFGLARFKRLRKFWWTENVYYNADKKNAGGGVGLLNRLLVLGNAVASAESMALARVRFGSAGVLFSAVARGGAAS
jgi:SAM-dependent methyltransferase